MFEDRGDDNRVHLTTLGGRRQLNSARLPAWISTENTTSGARALHPSTSEAPYPARRCRSATSVDAPGRAAGEAMDRSDPFRRTLDIHKRGRENPSSHIIRTPRIEHPLFPFNEATEKAKSDDQLAPSEAVALGSGA
jgi:hypothetical protein